MSAYQTSAIDHVFPYPGQDILDLSSKISLVGMLSAHLIIFVISSMFGLSEPQRTILLSYSLKITIGKEEKTKICVLLTRVCYTLCSVFRVPNRKFDQW